MEGCVLNGTGERRLGGHDRRVYDLVRGREDLDLGPGRVLDFIGGTWREHHSSKAARVRIVRLEALQTYLSSGMMHGQCIYTYTLTPTPRKEGDGLAVVSKGREHIIINFTSELCGWGLSRCSDDAYICDEPHHDSVRACRNALRTETTITTYGPRTLYAVS
jgi:hypothetical protein